MALLIAGAAALWALQRLPYADYSFIRLVIFCGAGYGAYRFARRDVFLASLVCACASLIFNPLIPLHMHRMQWHSVDLCTGFIMFLMAAIAYKYEHSGDKTKGLNR